MVNFMARESTFGWTVLAMKANSSKVWDMDRATGSQPSQMETFTLECMKMTRSAAMADTSGRMGASTKVDSRKMWSKIYFINRHGKGRLTYQDGK